MLPLPWWGLRAMQPKPVGQADGSGLDSTAQPGCGAVEVQISLAALGQCLALYVNPFVQRPVVAAMVFDTHQNALKPGRTAGEQLVCIGPRKEVKSEGDQFIDLDLEILAIARKPCEPHRVARADPVGANPLGGGATSRQANRAALPTGWHAHECPVRVGPDIDEQVRNPGVARFHRNLEGLLHQPDRLFMRHTGGK